MLHIIYIILARKKFDSKIKNKLGKNVVKLYLYVSCIYYSMSVM